MIFLNVSEKLFVVQKINLEESLIYRGGLRRVPKSIDGQTECESEIPRAIDQKLILSSFICLC